MITHVLATQIKIQGVFIAGYTEGQNERSFGHLEWMISYLSEDVDLCADFFPSPFLWETLANDDPQYFMQYYYALCCGSIYSRALSGLDSVARAEEGEIGMCIMGLASRKSADIPYDFSQACTSSSSSQTFQGYSAPQPCPPSSASPWLSFNISFFK